MLYAKSGRDAEGLDDTRTILVTIKPPLKS
jgi:hypothetical protein